MNAALLDDLYTAFHDDEVFARESLMVQDKLGALVDMQMGPAPKKLAAVIRKQREAGKPVRIIVLKARQVWISTYIASRYWRDTAHKAGQHTLVLAQDEDTAANVFRYYQTFHDQYKPFRGVIARPERDGDSSEILEYKNGSYIKFHTAKTTTIGRSRSLRRVHFSEFAFYGDNARPLMGAVMSAVPGDADTEVLVESSANGVGNEFHTMWLRAVSGESEWIAFFFAWWEHPEYVKPLSIPADLFERSLTDQEREMRQAYNLSHEQLNWRRSKIANDLNGDEDLFCQEFPSNPEEAFLTSGRPRFDHKAIARMPVLREALEGGLELIDVGGHKKLRFLPRHNGELVIYRQPQEYREYVIGADSAEGIDVNGGKGKADPDYAVAQVLDRDTGEQVARLRARFTPAEFGYQLYMLGVYYHWAQMVPEANGSALATIDAVLNAGYPTNLLYHRVQTADQDPAVRSDLIGWKQTSVTRPQMISLLDDAIRELAVLIHDPVTLAELRTFVIKSSGRAEHSFSTHDDTVFALGLAVVGMAQMPRKPKNDLRKNSGPIVNNYKKRGDDEDERGKRVRMF